MWSHRLGGPSIPAQLTAAFVDGLLARAATLAPLVEYFRAHLDARAPGSARSSPEHVVDLLTLGVRWRAHARATLRRPGARPDHAAVAALLARRRTTARGAVEAARLADWNDFARDENCFEAIDEAVGLAAWFEASARAALGVGADGIEGQLDLVRTEVLARALRDRRRPAAPPTAGRAARPPPPPPPPAAAPRPAARLTRAS